MSASPLTRDRFEGVAEAYDQAPNPLLRLEERVLPGVLPVLRNRDAVDVGCGTGRWFPSLLQSGVRTLKGVDPSPAMLAIAEKHDDRRVQVVQGRAEALPVVDGSADLALFSFALSHCENVRDVVRELSRILRPGGSVVISDMHPETEVRLGWKRAFRAGSGAMTMRTTRHALAAVEEAFVSAGFKRTAHFELPFGEVERALLVENGMEAVIDQTEGLPAIYVSRYDLAPKTAVSCVIGVTEVALGSDTRVYATVAIGGERIAAITELSDLAAETVDGSGCLVMPGLINAHDHLEFGLFPNLGQGQYSNSREWAEDIHRRHSALIAQHSQVSRNARLYWGGLRNLLSGVTTVCHHNPYSETFEKADFPVRVVSDFGWAHSLAFDREVKDKWNRTPGDWPFIIHAAEGVDDASSDEVTRLDRLGLLDERAVLVHGVNLSEADIGLLNARGAGLITCPSSNCFLLGRSLEAQAVSQLERLAIGTDSPLTARGDLLTEVRVAHEVFGLRSQHLYKLCTDRSADLLRLSEGEGRLTVGGSADLLIVRSEDRPPADALLNLQAEQIELVLINGRVHLASESGLNRVPAAMLQHLSPLRVDGRVVWVNAPVDWMLQEAQAVFSSGVITLAGQQVSRVD